MERRANNIFSGSDTNPPGAATMLIDRVSAIFYDCSHFFDISNILLFFQICFLMATVHNRGYEFCTAVSF